MLTVVTGPMWAGKSSYLINRVKHLKTYSAFKPSIDDRYGNGIVNHDKEEIIAKNLPLRFTIEDLGKIEKLVIFDESQFFEKESLLKTIHLLYKNNKKIICAGLRQDSNGLPFGAMPELLAMADDIVLLKATCVICGEDATKTFRDPSADNSTVLVGNMYQARCRQCWYPISDNKI